MKIKSWMLGLIVIVFIFGGIGVSSVTGSWQTTTNKIPAKYTTGEYTGQYNPADIRGSYTFGEISDTFNVPLNDLTMAFGIDTNRSPAEFQVKELESLYIDAATGKAVGTNSVRLFVALYKGLPITLSDTDYLLPAAVRILKDNATLTTEQVLFLDTHILLLTTSTTPTVTAAPSSSSELTHTTTLGTITGKTTFQELLDWGVTQRDIEAAINDKLPAKSMAVRDYASQKGVEFTVLKAQLQTLVDSLKK